MYCSYLFCLSLCIGTALAVLYNGEAHKHNIEPLSGGLQHQHTQQHTQQQQHQQTLPGYHYSVPTSTPQTASATSQHAFAGYRYNTPAAPTTTTTAKPTTTTTTTVRPPVTAAATQASTAGYFYSPPAAAGYSDHTFYPPYYQQTHHAPALAISSDTNVQQQLPLSDAPTYFVPQSDAGNVRDKHQGDMTNFFVPRDNRGKVEVPQATHSAQQPEKELHRTEAAAPAYNYPRPASGAELAAEPLTTYQRVFHEFADYLIWQRAQAKQREQQQQLPRIVTNGVPKSQVNTLPHLTQGNGASVVPQFNYPAAHKQFSYTASQQAADASFPAKNYAQSATAPPSNVFPQYAAQRRPAESSALLAGERYISPNSAVEYLEMPSESWELPAYTSMEAVAAVSNSELSVNLAAAQPDTGRGDQPQSQMFYDAAAQQNAQYLYERENRLVQTTPHIVSGETKGPQEEKVMQVQQQHAESAQRYAPALQQQQHTPTDLTQSKLTQPNAVQFAQIPQWPQNLALQAQHHQQRLTQQQLATQQQQEQQRPLYNRVVAPLMPTAQLPVSVSQQQLPEQSFSQSSKHIAGGYAEQTTLADQQQEKQLAKQQFYLQAQQQQIEPPSHYIQSTQLAAQPTQPSLTSSSSNSDSNSYFHLDTNVFRRPHSSYGVPSENANTGGYSYQRPVGQ